MKEKDTFTVITDDGREVLCHVLFTFDSDETGKSYIVYTDFTKDKNGQTQVYASIFDPEDPNTKLEEIKTEKEWKVIDTILSTLQEEVKKQTNNESDNN